MKSKTNRSSISETVQVEWLSIDFGHISPKRDDSDHADCSDEDPSDQQEAVLDAIPIRLRRALSAGGTITVPKDPKSDEWVSKYLQLMLAPVIGVGVLDITEGDVVRFTVPKPEEARKKGENSEFWPWTSPDSGTHCRLRGDRWINERTYRLYAPAVGGAKRTPWLSAALKGHVATVTLVWVCRELEGTKWGVSR